MTNGEIFQLILERLKAEPFLNGFKFRKRDSSFLKQDGDLRQSIELDHWSKQEGLIIYPIYGVRFEILLKWFEQYSFKSLQTQRDIPSVDFTGQAESTVHMLNWAIRSVKFLGVEFDQSEDEEVSVSDTTHL